jgi:predicted methyltransferase
MTFGKQICTALLCLGFSGYLTCALAADSGAAAIAKAVADASRPEADTVRDADRKPAEVIAFAGIHPGSKVAEIWPGGGYFTRIFSKLVGPQGVVYALVPAPPPNAPPGRDPGAALRALAGEAGYGNIKVATIDPATPPPEPVDVVWTSLNYHDMHSRPDADMSPINRLAFNALKPGGVYIVIDHAAEKGSGVRDVQLHRMDEDLVKSEVTSVGFEAPKESQLLRHPDDTRKQSSHAVARGKSDQFVLMFRKPRK